MTDPLVALAQEWADWTDIRLGVDRAVVALAQGVLRLTAEAQARERDYRQLRAERDTACEALVTIRTAVLDVIGHAERIRLDV